MPSDERSNRGGWVITAVSDSVVVGDEVAAQLARAEAAHSIGNLSVAESLYRSILAVDPHHVRALHNLGVIALRMGYPGGAETLLRRAIALDPTMAEAHSNLGLALSGTGRGDEARRAFEQAVSLHPDYAEAWSNLAILDQSEGHALSAVAKFRRATLAADQGRPEIACNLGAALIEAGEVEEGAEILTRLLPRMPRSAALQFNLGKARFLQSRLGEAIAHLRQAIVIEPGFPDAHHTLAHALLASGQLEEGWREYEWRWRAKTFRVPPRDFAFPQWRGEPVKGKRVLLWSEQGIGDKLLFAGLLPEFVALGADVTIEIEERLVPLFRRSFPNIRVVPRADRPDEALLSGQFDFQAPLGDLPRYLRPSLPGFRPVGAYLAADPIRTADLRHRYEAGHLPLIGIAWASRPPKGIPLLAFAPLLQIPGVRWVNLQYGDHAEEIAQVQAKLSIRIVTDASVDPLADFDGSVAQTAALDAVVTIQNATLYTAAGLGLPTFAVTPPEPDWRWFGSDHSPWHESVRLYRRDLGDDAASTLARLAEDFLSWLDYRPR